MNTMATKRRNASVRKPVMSRKPDNRDSEKKDRHAGEAALLASPKPEPQPLVGHDREVDSEWAEKAAVGFYIEFAFAALGSIAALVGLVSVLEITAGSIAVILFALGLLVASVARRFAVKARTRETGMAEVGGLSSEYLVGGPALVLGIFALAGIVPVVLTAVAALFVWSRAGVRRNGSRSSSRHEHALSVAKPPGASCGFTAEKRYGSSNALGNRRVSTSGLLSCRSRAYTISSAGIARDRPGTAPRGRRGRVADG
jgi:hypothetical protein